jgi:poly-gamma-glutamate synthesis protein (capsule biosynthesis protein)
VNPLGVTVWNTVTAEQFNQLKAILDSVLARRHDADVIVPSDLPPPLPPGRLMLWGQRFMVAAKPGEIHYDLDPSDEQAQILAVRNAKEVADFVAFHMHVHHNRYSFQQYSHDNYPPDYLRPFLHKLIDNGLDMYLVPAITRCRASRSTRAVPSSTTRGTLAPIWYASLILRPAPANDPHRGSGTDSRVHTG